MDKASAHGAGDCRFESCRGQAEKARRRASLFERAFCCSFGPVDKASANGAGGCRLESRGGHAVRHLALCHSPSEHRVVAHQLWPLVLLASVYFVHPLCLIARACATITVDIVCFGVQRPPPSLRMSMQFFGVAGPRAPTDENWGLNTARLVSRACGWLA